MLRTTGILIGIRSILVILCVVSINNAAYFAWLTATPIEQGMLSAIRNRFYIWLFLFFSALCTFVFSFWWKTLLRGFTRGCQNRTG